GDAMRSAAFLLLATVSGVVVFLAGSAGIAAPVPKHLMKAAENTEQSKLQGKWKLESTKTGPGEEVTFEIRDTAMTVFTAQGEQKSGTVKFDTIDGFNRLSVTGVKRVGRDGRPGSGDENASFGYRFDGDKLILAARHECGNEVAVDPAKLTRDTDVFVFV